MGRYILFGGDDTDYSSGGWHDLIDQSDDRDEMIQLGKIITPDYWWHVVDMDSGKIIAGSKVQAETAPALDPLNCLLF